MGKEIKSPEIEKRVKRPDEDIGPEEAKKLNRNRDKR
jgi:hypothetical protein